MINQALWFQWRQQLHWLAISMTYAVAILGSVALLADLTRTCAVQIQTIGK